MSEIGGQPNRIEKNTKIKGDIISEADLLGAGEQAEEMGISDKAKALIQGLQGLASGGGPSQLSPLRNSWQPFT